MSDLKEDLDRALRTVPFSEAPVERAKQHGRRLRTRRRLSVVAGAVVVAAIVAGYPALTRSGAAGPATPAVGSAKPTPKPSAGHDPVLTAGPPGGTTEAPGGLTDKSGIVAEGSISSAKWRVTVHKPGATNPVAADSCYTVTLPSGADGTCVDLPSSLNEGLGASVPARFTGVAYLAPKSSAITQDAVIGIVAPDVTYFIVTFNHGQQLKLLPVTVGGHRYVAWVAPASMTVDSVIAHLGGPYSDSGLVAATTPWDLPGQMPVFGLWRADGQSAPPLDSGVIGSGTTDGHAWKVTAYEGPWGTCFVTGPNDWECVPVKQLATTTVLGGWGGNPPEPAAFGSAARGVALVRVTLSNGKTVTARPVGVGNENLFAFPIGKGVTPVRWTAYDASGKQTGTATLRTGTATATKSASP